MCLSHYYFKIYDLGDSTNLFPNLSFFPHVAYEVGAPCGKLPASLSDSERSSVPTPQLPRPRIWASFCFRKQVSTLCLPMLPLGHCIWWASFSTQQPITPSPFHILPPFKFVLFFLWKTLILPQWFPSWNMKLKTFFHFPPPLLDFPSVFIKINYLSLPFTFPFFHTHSHFHVY